MFPFPNLRKPGLTETDIAVYTQIFAKSFTISTLSCHSSLYQREETTKRCGQSLTYFSVQQTMNNCSWEFCDSFISGTGSQNNHVLCDRLFPFCVTRNGKKLGQLFVRSESIEMDTI